MPLVRRLALLLALEGVALVGLGIADLVAGGSSTPTRVAGVSAIVTGLVLGWLGLATERRRSWACSPAIVLNFLPLPIAADAFSSGAWYVGLPLAAFAGTALYLLFHADVRAALPR